MKTLILQRHAEAEAEADDDLVRTLTPGGISDTAVQGETIRQMELYPELILHSSAMRARQTAEIMAAKLELSQGYTIEDAALYSCDADGLLAILRHLPDESDIVLVVAHNPAIEIVAAALANITIEHLRTAEAVAMTFNVSEWNHIGQENCTDSKFLAKPI